VRQGITDTNRMRLVLFDMQNRTLGPYLAAIDRILIEVMRLVDLRVWSTVQPIGYRYWTWFRGLRDSMYWTWFRGSGTLCTGHGFGDSRTLCAFVAASGVHPSRMAQALGVFKPKLRALGSAALAQSVPGGWNVSGPITGVGCRPCPPFIQR
jgi:hypothetical protein